MRLLLFEGKKLIQGWRWIVDDTLNMKCHDVRHNIYPNCLMAMTDDRHITLILYDSMWNIDKKLLWLLLTIQDRKSFKKTYVFCILICQKIKKHQNHFIILLNILFKQMHRTFNTLSTGAIKPKNNYWYTQFFLTSHLTRKLKNKKDNLAQIHKVVVSRNKVSLINDIFKNIIPI